MESKKNKAKKANSDNPARNSKKGGVDKAVEKASAASAEKSKFNLREYTSSLMDSLRIWFKGIKSEFKKIVWPTKEQLSIYTGVVFVTLIAVAMYLAALGWVFSSFFRQIGIA